MNNNSIHKWILYAIFLIIAFLFLLLFSTTTSPLYLHDGVDSIIYKTMGLALLKGKTLYVDIFDHKGFILYLINAIGLWISTDRWGLFLIQVLGLSVALLFMYKTARLFTSNRWAIAAVLIALLFLIGVFQGGNLTEEWNVYLFCISLYIVSIYFRYNASKSFPFKSAFFLGVLFGIGFFIRPNDAVAQIGGALLGVILWRLKQKDLKNIISTIGFFVFGTFLITSPIFLYFATKHAIGDMLYGLIIFNQEYAGGWGKMFVSIFSHNKLSILLVLITLCVFLYNKEDKVFLWAIVPICFLQLLFIGIRMFPHYLIVLMPFISLLVAIASMHRDITLKIITLFIFLCTPIVNDRQIVIASANTTIGNYYCYKNNKTFFPKYKFETESLLNNVPDEKKDSIFNYNLEFEIRALLINNLVQCNKITFASNDKLTQTDRLSKIIPPYVLVWSASNCYKEDKYLNNHYEPIAHTDTNICKFILYKRNIQ